MRKNNPQSHLIGGEPMAITFAAHEISQVTVVALKSRKALGITIQLRDGTLINSFPKGGNGVYVKRLIDKYVK